MLIRLLSLIIIPIFALKFSIAEEAKNTDQWKVIHAGTLLNDARKTPLKEHSVIIKNDTIVAITEGFIDKQGAQKYIKDETSNIQLIDLSEKFVMAGMIDTHTHIGQELNKNSRIERVTLTDSDRAIQAIVNAKKIALAGFTTIRNVGDPRESINAVRDAINKGLVEGPFIHSSAFPIITLGGHGDINGYKYGLFSDDSRGICTGADDCRRAVREQIKYGADMIKYASTGGVLSDIATGTGQQFTDEEQRAIVETAHSMGRKVAAHAHNKDGIDAAIRAGADSIEHGTYLDQETIKLFKQHNTYLVPTVLAGVTAGELAEIPNYFTPSITAKAKKIGPMMLDVLGVAYRGGVKIAFGTDSGVSKHGINGRELELMVQAGMTEKDVLISATINAADLMGLSHQIATLETGKKADIIAANDNPLQDISTLKQPVFVMTRGKVLKP